MTPTSQEPKRHVTTDFEAHRKAFYDSMETLQHQLATATAEINALRVNLKSQTAEAEVKTMARVHDLTSELDAARKEQHDLIEAHLKVLDAEVEAISAEMKHASAAGKMAAEAKVKEIRQEIENARKAAITSLDAELAEWKARIDEVVHRAAEKTSGAKAGIQAKMADLHAKHAAAEKKLHALQEANAAAFSELQRGTRASMAEIKTALQHARADIAAAS